MLFIDPPNGNGERERGANAHGSDYEDSRENTMPPLRDNPRPDSRPESTSEVYSGAGRPTRDAPEIAREAVRILEHPWYPFLNPYEFKQAH